MRTRQLDVHGWTSVPGAVDAERGCSNVGEAAGQEVPVSRRTGCPRATRMSRADGRRATKAAGALSR